MLVDCVGLGDWRRSLENVVVRVNDFSCTVKSWDGEYTVAFQHLKSYNYLPAEWEQIQLISDRISRLRENENLEDAPSAVLKHLGELKRPYLTAVEEKLLGLIEKEYGVNVVADSNI
ncbi:hypothetical protein [Nostoc sphaeroides]|uniref:Uncharacterized protein n=1 Tax=Nostoc sphaeroides CCNUC1 TaxID=2653204 RepID=A0A5P8WCC6_9NOSO|nr:hypothetical protein [Nostoc sphaeroides]QFS50202.1 hypothetical protein GXM_07696 [Nostoc sphaeroides CCNUC1]